MSEKTPKVARRLEELPPYLFSELGRLEAETRARGISVLSLGIGDPDQPTPESVIQVLREASLKPRNHAYSPYGGTAEFRQAARAYFQQRFGVSLNPDKEITALIGSKEGIAHFALAFCNPGDICLYPSPGYPVYSASIILSGGSAVPVPLLPEYGFLPDLNHVEFLMLKHRPKFMFVNFPSNPTSVMCPLSMVSDLVFLARKYSVWIASDCAYSEIYYDDNEKPRSILEIEGAKDLAIEFHSFSKTFNMTGWRLGFAVGNEALVSGLARVKTNVDSGPLLAVQEAGVYALKNAANLSSKTRSVYAERCRALRLGLDNLGIEYIEPKATFFVWAKVPGKERSMPFMKELLSSQGLVVTPGVGFGEHGEHYFRMAMTISVEEIGDALARLGRYLGKKN